jgi:hypothetical protein
VAPTVLLSGLGRRCGTGVGGETIQLLSINWEVLTRDLRASRHVSAADCSFDLAPPPAATRVSRRLGPFLTYRQ